MANRPAVSSHSLGRAWVHDIESKLKQAALYGLDIELFYEDLQYVAQELPGGENEQNLLVAAEQIRSQCDESNIEIICLQPFMHYEGLRDRKKHEERKDEMRLWLQLAHVLNTKLIAVPSSFLPEEQISGDRDLIVSDLRALADLAATENVQIAYESLAWGTYVNTWEDCWDIVQQVDRTNFGICLDTFNIAAKVYADPASASRTTANAEKAIEESLERLARSIDAAKIFLVQIVDGQYLEEPLVEGHELYDPTHCDTRMSWSRACRLFYGEQDRGGYLPIHKIMEAIIVDVGYPGRISAELFNQSLTESDSNVPAEHARRAYESWQKLVQDFEGQLSNKPPLGNMETSRNSQLALRAQL